MIVFMPVLLPLLVCMPTPVPLLMLMPMLVSTLTSMPMFTPLTMPMCMPMPVLLLRLCCRAMMGKRMILCMEAMCVAARVEGRLKHLPCGNSSNDSTTP